MVIIPSKAVFNDTDLAQLEWVYDDVRAALEARRGQLEDETKLSIRRRLSHARMQWDGRYRSPSQQTAEQLHGLDERLETRPPVVGP